MTISEQAYLFDYSGSDLGAQQVNYLELVLDDVTTPIIDSLGLLPGQTCLDVGAGNGSISRSLAERVGPDGRVVVAELETARVVGGPGIEIHEHDISNGVPAGGPFDLIHARLVLMHLPRRREIVADLIDALAPGGWLLLGEAHLPSPGLLAAPTQQDADLFHRLHEVAVEAMVAGGVDLDWAYEAEASLAASGLVDVHARRHSDSVTGGEPGAVLMGNYAQQTAPLLSRAGLSDGDREQFLRLTLDPRFRAWFYEAVHTWGRKPARS